MRPLQHECGLLASFLQPRGSISGILCHLKGFLGDRAGVGYLGFRKRSGPGRGELHRAYKEGMMRRICAVLLLSSAM